MKSGKIYILPSVIAYDDIAYTHLPKGFNEIVENIHICVVENIRTTRRFLVKVGLKHVIEHLVWIEMDKHNAYQATEEVLLQVLQGKNMGVFSESGMPGIADPGNLWVKKAHELNIPVQAISGPSSIMLLLSASGLNGQQFCFNGYLPKEASERKNTILKLENFAQAGITQIFIETPYRNMAILEELLKYCKPSTLLCLGYHLTSQKGWVKTKNIAEWKSKIQVLDKVPVIFALGK